MLLKFLALCFPINNQDPQEQFYIWVFTCISLHVFVANTDMSVFGHKHKGTNQKKVVASTCHVSTHFHPFIQVLLVNFQLEDDVSVICFIKRGIKKKKIITFFLLLDKERVVIELNFLYLVQHIFMFQTLPS